MKEREKEMEVMVNSFGDRGEESKEIEKLEKKLGKDEIVMEKWLIVKEKRKGEKEIEEVREMKRNKIFYIENKNRVREIIGEFKD